MSARVFTLKTQLQHLLTKRPFQPFVLTTESGDHVIIEHPENIAFAPMTEGDPGPADFSVITGQRRLYGTFEAVSALSELDLDGLARQNGSPPVDV